MSVRIESAQAKVSSIVVTYVFGGTIAIGVGLIVGAPAGAITVLILVIASVVFFTRVFRGESEDIAPARHWWRMTERPRAGYVLAVLFAADAVFLTATFRDGIFAVNVIAIAIYALIAVAFLNSSMRLTATGRDAVMKSEVGHTSA